MQCQKSLTLCWSSFLGGSKDIVSSIVAHSGRQYYHYGWMPLYSPVIIQDERTEIVDAPLTLISMMEYRACCFPFYQVGGPIFHRWMEATTQPCDCWMCKTIHCWCTVDTYLWAHLRDIPAVIGCSTIVQRMHTVFIGSQYTVSVYCHVNSRSSRHVSFWPATIHVICMMNDVGPSCFSSFSP